MKISIITPTFNSVKTVDDTVRSVLSQAYSDIEYIIVDGGSTDGTLSKIESYGDRISKIISAPPLGIYDAMNKGIEAASGDIVGIINSDDFYIDDHVLNKVAAAFEDTSVDAVYGDLVFVDQEDTKKIVRLWRAGHYNEAKLSHGWIMPHPAFFVRKRVYDAHGSFRLDIPIAADFELMLRFLKKGHITVAYISEVLVKMRVGGASTRSLRNRITGMQQLVRAWKVNGMRVPILFYLRPLFKLGQFIKRG